MGSTRLICTDQEGTPATCSTSVLETKTSRHLRVFSQRVSSCIYVPPHPEDPYEPQYLARDTTVVHSPTPDWTEIKAESTRPAPRPSSSSRPRFSSRLEQEIFEDLEEDAGTFHVAAPSRSSLDTRRL